MTKENEDTNIIQNDGITRLISDTFHDLLMDDNFDEHVLEVPLTDKAHKPLYKAQGHILSFLLYCW